MPFQIKTRYGATETYADDADIPVIANRLIEELETEQFDEPDNEHTQIAISRGDWAVTVEVSGLMTLDDLPGSEADIPTESLHLRAKSREEAAEMLTKMARGELDAIQAAGWVPFDQLQPYKEDLFRTERPGP